MNRRTLIPSLRTVAVLFLSVGVGMVNADNAAEPAPDTGIGRPVPFTSVKVTGGFWHPRMETNRTRTVAYCFERCEDTGRIANFARAGGLEEGPFEGIFYNDSDVFKVIEGAAYELSLSPDPALDRKLDEVIAKIAAAQEEDGYLFTARTLGADDKRYGMDERWSYLRKSHELYNVGHLYEAAVAHYQATGKRSLLDVATKNADLLLQVFGARENQRIDVPGHQEIEIGLVRLYGVTGRTDYLNLAKFFVDMRGRKDLRGELYGEYAQDHKPVVEQDTAVGHSVRAGYMYTAMADLAALAGDRAYQAAIDRIWDDMLNRKMFITGGVGLHGHREGYGKPYDLAGSKSYSETCAAIANAMWAHRMFLLHREGGYMDVFERIIYNGFLSGVSLSGDRFFYPNTLETDGIKPHNHKHRERAPWFGTSCCPVNVVRFTPSLPGYVYATDDEGLFVNLFLSSDAEVPLEDQTIRIRQQTAYPWEGRIRMEISPERPEAFAVRIRVPGWLQGRPVPGTLYRYLDDRPVRWSILLNGEPVEPEVRNGYAVIKRTWSEGDKLLIDYPMPVRRVLSDERVKANANRVAIERGPVVYCVEGADNDGHALDLFLPDDSELEPTFEPSLLGGIMTLTGRGGRVLTEKKDDRAVEPFQLTMIPYYAWCHRGPNAMQVFLPRDAETVP